MNTRAKTVLGGEWVKVRNYMNTRFHAAGPCELCGRERVEPVWYSLKTKGVRCCQCFEPDQTRLGRANVA